MPVPVEVGYVRTCGERQFTSAGEDDHPDIVVGGNLFGDAGKQPPAFVGDGVSSLRPVEGDGRDAVTPFTEDVGCHG